MAQRAVEPLYVTLTNGFSTRTGKIRFLVCGSDGEDEDQDEKETEDKEDESSEDSSGKKDSTDKDSDDDKDAVIASLRKRMKAADKNNSSLAQRLKDIEDKDKDEKTKATERAEELESKTKEDAETISGLNLQVAFLLSNDQQWDDPEYALDFAQRKGYLDDVVDDGEIDRDALKKALDKLAKDKPSMIKRASKDDEEEEDGNPPATDQGVGNRRKNGKGKERDDTVLAGRYPAAFRY